jgi:hypothetical protein
MKMYLAALTEGQALSIGDQQLRIILNMEIIILC